MLVPWRVEKNIQDISLSTSGPGSRSECELKPGGVIFHHFLIQICIE